jgi:hypothetical protein
MGIAKSIQRLEQTRCRRPAAVFGNYQDIGFVACQRRGKFERDESRRPGEYSRWEGAWRSLWHGNLSGQAFDARS